MTRPDGASGTSRRSPWVTRFSAATHAAATAMGRCVIFHHKAQPPVTTTPTSRSASGSCSGEEWVVPSAACASPMPMLIAEPLRTTQ